MTPPNAFRHDVVTNRWTLVAPARKDTPLDVVHSTTVTASPSQCPFCPGHEHLTNPTLSQRFFDDGRWSARAFLNKYPMVAEGSEAPLAVPGRRLRAPRGVHEVLVETEAHDRDVGELPEHLGPGLASLYRERLQQLSAHPAARAVLLYKNRGPRAGASLMHAHAQVCALPLVPTEVRRRDVRARRLFTRRGAAPVVLSRDRELADAVRVVETSAHFVVFCPFASHRSLETWIVPLAPTPSLARCSDAVTDDFGRVLVRTLKRFHAVTRGGDYNLVHRTPALAHHDAPWALWHLEILPRHVREAGYELATGMFCTTSLPEESAAHLRDAL